MGAPEDWWDRPELANDGSERRFWQEHLERQERQKQRLQQTQPPRPPGGVVANPPERQREDRLQESGDGKDGSTDASSHPRLTRWWARNINRRSARGTAARPIPRVGSSSYADAAWMLEALATPEAAKRVGQRSWWRTRAQAVLALAAALAVTGQVAEVLGTCRRRWWMNLCRLTAPEVGRLQLPPVAERVVRRWMDRRWPLGPNVSWVAWVSAPMASRDARERLGMVCARESHRLLGYPMRPTALLRWRFPIPDSLNVPNVPTSSRTLWTSSGLTPDERRPASRGY